MRTQGETATLLKNTHINQHTKMMYRKYNEVATAS